jgi:transcriptional regulator with XRE-family HTH domain
MVSKPPQLTLAQEFGRKLKQLRREKSAHEERDVEQSEVADAIDETQPNLARYERGRFPKDEAVTKRLAAYYRVNYAWLRLNEGEKRPPGLDIPAPARSTPAAAGTAQRNVAGRKPR